MSEFYPNRARVLGSDTLSVWNICANIPQMSFGSEASGGIENSLRASSLGRFTTGREKEGELATMFLEFEYLHQVYVKC